MKVLIFIDHDIICRHFIMSGALAELPRRCDVRFVFPDDGGKRVKLDPAKLPLGAPFERLPVDAERQQTWRWLLFADQLKLRLGAHEAAIRRLRWLTLGWKAATILTLASAPLGRSIFQRIVERRLALHPNRALDALLDREGPDVVLHPSVLEGIFINDLAAACRARSIPLVVAMNSWDNPSTKRAVVGSPDRLLVWGPQTHDHARRFIGMDERRITCFGAAQFDVFREPPRIGRQAFCEAHRLDPEKRIVLFAGSNAQTDEVAALAGLDAAIEDERLPGMQIVYRPHPWGGGGRDGARLAAAHWRHVRVDRTMRAYLDRVAAGDQSMSLPDYRDAHDLLSIVDVVVSPLSTILLEGALHGRSVIVFAPDDGGKVLQAMMPMLHFEEFLALPDVLTARTIDDLVAKLSKIGDSETASARGARLRAAMERFVTPFDCPWRERIIEVLREAASAKGSTADLVAAG